MTGSARETSQLVDVGLLQDWLTKHVPEVGELVRLELISAGRSNLTYSLEGSGGSRYVLRRPPTGTLQATAHDVEREHRIISALRPTGLPLPPTLAFCPDPNVIGAPFFLMRFVAGTVVTDRAAARTLDPDIRQRVSTALPIMLARLHAVDLDEVGLGDLRRSRGYVERQLRRWGRQVDDYEAPCTAQLRSIGDRLARRVPAPQSEVLLHGDFKMENMMLSLEGTVAAILDWELAAVGDPLADLAWLLIWWGQPGDDGPWMNPPPTSVGGFLDRESLLATYTAASLLDTTSIAYYLAFSYWRLSCINAGTRTRFLAGAMGAKVIDVEALDHQVAWQLDAAGELLSSGNTAR